MNPDSGLRFEEGDVIESQGRLWLVRNKRVEVSLECVELDSETPATPVTMLLQGREEEPIFDRAKVVRLVRES